MCIRDRRAAARRRRLRHLFQRNLNGHQRVEAGSKSRDLRAQQFSDSLTTIHGIFNLLLALDLLAADVETLSSSLDGLRRLQKARPTLAVAPTPVKAAVAPTKGSSSPPVSPLLRFEEEEAAAGAKALCN